MAVFLGAHDQNILEWRGVAELYAGFRGEIADTMAARLSGENVALLRELTRQLDTEIAHEERFATEFGGLLEQLDRAGHPDDIAAVVPCFERLVKDYFRERGSAIAVHRLCSTYRDAVVRRALRWAEESLELDEKKRPPAPYCWFGGGSTGRLEQTFCVEPGYYLIHGDADDAPGYFEQFSCRAAALLARSGLLPGDGGAATMKALWRGGRNAWRREVIDGFRPRERKGIEALLERADLRFIEGDAGLADEMLNVVRSMLGFHHGDLREAAVSPDLTSLFRTVVARPVPLYLSISRRVADIAEGLDFFGRFRVEKSDRYKGLFALEQRALAPLVAKARILALEFGLKETSTIGRIKQLQREGRLSVDLAERLLRAFHDFSRLSIRSQIEAGCESERACFLDPQQLTEDDELRLKSGMAALADLEKIIYLCFTEQGQ